ncbi:MAG: F0F1 ATP synthase subunit epsilon [Candidatus Saccharimonadales bacterium]
MKQLTQQFTVRILSPTARLYDGQAVSLSAINKVGPFDILAGHSNLFTILEASDVVVNTGKEERRFPVTQGLMKVHDDVVTLYVDIESVGNKMGKTNPQKAIA